ncbi:MAG: hypothetical protein N3B16_05125 [Candidatus Aminicenantes bacterium]|nr:hypothetical protein [Candidatus Aminicenantes bacterium]
MRRNRQLKKWLKEIGQRGMIIFQLLVLSGLIWADQLNSSSTEGYRLSSLPSVYLEFNNLEPGLISVDSFQKEIPFVTLVPFQQEAQVVISFEVNRQAEKVVFHLRLKGQKELAGEIDELKTELPLSASREDIYRELLGIIKPALMRFVGQSSIFRRVQIKFMEEVKPTSVVDPWNFWVFNLNLNSFLNGEKAYDSKSFYGSFSASRITPDWKIRLSLSGSWSESEFRYGEQIIKSTSEGGNFQTLVVRSLNDHWSIGAFFSAVSSTYENVKLSLAPAPAIEYNIFPYSESTRRQLRFLYRLSFTSVNYREETIYLKTTENLWRQFLTVVLELKRNWGTVSFSVEGSNYFHNWHQNRMRLSSELSLRLFKGLSCSLNGAYSRIRDQISLPRRGATLEEVLLRRRQLETSYNYYFSIGLNYSFGSLLSKIVNPRFGEGGGFSISISM